MSVPSFTELIRAAVIFGIIFLMSVIRRWLAAYDTEWAATWTFFNQLLIIYGVVLIIVRAEQLRKDFAAMRGIQIREAEARARAIKEVDERTVRLAQELVVRNAEESAKRHEALTERLAEVIERKQARESGHEAIVKAADVADLNKKHEELKEVAERTDKHVTDIHAKVVDGKDGEPPT